MPSPQDDIVLTGFGVVAPNGVGTDAFWKSLATQHGAVESFGPKENVKGRRWMAGLVHDLDAKAFVQPRKSLKVMCLETQMAFASAVMACRQSKIEPGTVAPDRLGLVFGSEMIFSENDDIQSIVELCHEDGEMKHEAWGATAIQNMYPLWMLKSLPNMPACHIGIWIDARTMQHADQR